MDRVAERQYRHLAKKGRSSILPGRRIPVRRWKYARPHKGYGWFTGSNAWYRSKGFPGWKLPETKTVLSWVRNLSFRVKIISLIIIIAFTFSVGVLGVGYAIVPPSSPPCVAERAPGAPCQDPSTLIWQENTPTGLGDFNSQGAAMNNNCSNGGANCLQLTATNGNTSVAITKVPIGDLSAAVGKTLAFNNAFQTQNGFGWTASSNSNWGFFLTTNSTVPTHDAFYSTSIVDTVTTQSFSLILRADANGQISKDGNVYTNHYPYNAYRAEFNLKRTGTPTGNLFAEVYTSSVPPMATPQVLLGTSNPIDVSTISTSSVVFQSFQFPHAISAQVNSFLFIVIDASNLVTDANDYVTTYLQNIVGTENKADFAVGGGWTADSIHSLNFEVDGLNQYTPYTDPNVLFLQDEYCSSAGGGSCGGTQGTGANYISHQFILKRPGVGDTLNSEDTLQCAGSGGSCIQTFSGQSLCCFNSTKPNNLFTAYLNYTGAIGAATTCTISGSTILGNGCTWLLAANTAVNPLIGSGVSLNPAYPFFGSNFYLGFFSRIPDFQLYWLPNPGVSCFGGSCGMDVFTYTPTPSCNNSASNGNACSNLDSGSFIGNAFNHYINGWSQLCQAIGITSFCAGVYTQAASVAQSLSTEVLQGLLTAGSAILSALSFFEGIVKGILNVVGVAFGFPASSNCSGGGTCGLGDDVFTFINSVITLFTVQVPNAFAQIGPIFNGWINSLVVVFTTGVIGQIFAFLSSILTFGANIIVFAFGLFTTGLQWTTLTAPFWLFIWFFAFNADEGMNGWIRWFEFAKWLAFDIGVKFVTNVINWTIDVITAAMALLPKPFVQIAGKFPRLPIIEIHGVFSVPDFNGRALREGNLFSILGMMFGFIGFVWYELTQTTIPGTLANQFSTQPWVQTASTAITFYKLFLPMGVLVVFLLMIPTLFTSIFGVVVPGPSVGFPKVRGTGPSRSFSVTGGSGRLFRSRAPGRRSQAFIEKRLSRVEEKQSTRLRNQREEEAREKAENERLSRQQEQEEARKLEAQRGREAEASVKRNEAAKQKALQEQRLSEERRTQSEERFT